MNFILAGYNVNPTPIINSEEGIITIGLQVVIHIEGAPTDKFQQVDNTSYTKPLTTPIQDLLDMAEAEAQSFVTNTYPNT